MSQHSRESPQEQIEESEVDLELQSSVEEVEETSITEPDEKVIKGDCNDVDALVLLLIFCWLGNL